MRWFLLSRNYPAKHLVRFLTDFLETLTDRQKEQNFGRLCSNINTIQENKKAQKLKYLEGLDEVERVLRMEESEAIVLEFLDSIQKNFENYTWEADDL